MSVNPFAAASAYANAARHLNQAGAGAGMPTHPAGGEGAGGFANLLQTALGDAVTSGQAVEAKAAGLGAGKTDVVDLVTAVAETELAVETLVTVRDRVISAYQDILNMPI
jgi:flagellar hook-basal body complex protein FliE